jgi:hypothetical protein
MGSNTDRYTLPEKKQDEKTFRVRIPEGFFITVLADQMRASKSAA